MMISEVCAEIRNYFSRPADRKFGAVTITGGSIAPLDFLRDGQYFRILGSVFNDGVHQYPADNLTDETFVGAIWPMRVPPDFLALCDEIKTYADSPAAQPGAYTSESFAGYSYTRAMDKNGAPLSWQTVYAKRLNKWRKLR